MESRFEQQLKKGALELVVLQLICQQPAYGYELILRLRAVGGGLLAVKEGTLYPILYRLEDDGLIEATWQTPADPAPARGRSVRVVEGADGPTAVFTTTPAPPKGRAAMPKKTYAATPAGREALARQRAVWQRFSACVGDILDGGQPAPPPPAASPAPSTPPEQEA